MHRPPSLRAMETMRNFVSTLSFASYECPPCMHLTPTICTIPTGSQLIAPIVRADSSLCLRLWPCRTRGLHGTLSHYRQLISFPSQNNRSQTTSLKSPGSNHLAQTSSLTHLLRGCPPATPCCRWKREPLRTLLGTLTFACVASPPCKRRIPTVMQSVQPCGQVACEASHGPVLGPQDVKLSDPSCSTIGERRSPARQREAAVRPTPPEKASPPPPVEDTAVSWSRSLVCCGLRYSHRHRLLLDASVLACRLLGWRLYRNGSTVAHRTYNNLLPLDGHRAWHNHLRTVGAVCRARRRTARGASHVRAYDKCQKLGGKAEP